MRVLPIVPPSPEQLPILNDSSPGFRLIRGAAGSGKTTTSLLRLRQLTRSRLQRHSRLHLSGPVRVLVLTYNSTLEGYIAELAAEQVAPDPRLEIQVSTFGRWARNLVGNVNLADRDQAARMVRQALLAAGLPAEQLDFFVEEVDYLLSRFEPADLDEYLAVTRRGRGTSPRVDVAIRRRLLDDVVPAYEAAKGQKGVLDWNDVALQAAVTNTDPYDVIIVDEAQDFSANQVRAVIAHASEEHSTTFVLDAVQRIYPRYFTWSEVGLNIRPNHTWRLSENHRNTAEIAAFARPLVDGLPLDDDGSLPDFSACRTSGRRPVVISGSYSDQLDYMLSHLLGAADLSTESVGILQTRSGRWFDFARRTLSRRRIDYCELTRQRHWPTGPAQVALSTIHSAKGLEFDHVLLPGLNQEVTPHGDGDGDAMLERFRRLVAMGVGRARLSVMVGYKPEDASTIVSLLDPTTYDLVEL